MTTDGDASPRRETATGAGAAMLERDSATPLYLQIAEQLATEIAAGKLQPRSSLGTESQLIGRFDVSRMTLRHAVELLVKRGLVTRQQGKGTYVASSPLELPLVGIQGTTQLASAAGRAVRSEVVRFSTGKGDAEVRRLLSANPGDQVTEVWRVDYSEDRPLALACIHLPGRIGRELNRDEMQESALYPLLQERFGIRPDIAHQTMHADAAVEEVARLLGVDEGTPTMVVTRLTRDESHAPIEYSIVRFRADAVRFSLSLRPKPGGAFDVPLRFEEHLQA